MTTYEAGRAREAEAEMRSIIDARVKTQGTDHPDVLFSCRNLAQMLANGRQYKDALQYARWAAEGRRRTQGANHPSTKDAEDLLAKIERASSSRR